MMIQKTNYDLEQLIRCGNGELFGAGNAQLPLPPMLMFDHISHISIENNETKTGKITATLNIKPELWFFGCHFNGDPVMPGCLGLDAMWQLLGFYLGWLGYPGKGRALGVDEVKFSGEVTPSCKIVEYKIDIQKVIARSFTMGMADAEMLCDGKLIYTAKKLKVGLFKNSM
jgi:3-hydroxyacyl-[acyl-carrier protein] dehydratase / trans-2-decenoyl-[acyl-carrier protein] isomerase